MTRWLAVRTSAMGRFWTLGLNRKVAVEAAQVRMLLALIVLPKPTERDGESPVGALFRRSLTTASDRHDRQ